MIHKRMMYDDIWRGACFAGRGRGFYAFQAFPPIRVKPSPWSPRNCRFESSPFGGVHGFAVWLRCRQASGVHGLRMKARKLIIDVLALLCGAAWVSSAPQGALFKERCSERLIQSHIDLWGAQCLMSSCPSLSLV